MASASDGDAIFVLTDADGGKHEVQVHSIVLKLASKVFAAMFGPHFSEGQDLNSNSPKRVEMPDDEPEAMKLLCDALHHRLEDTLTAPRGSLLDHVVKLVDKYDCSAAMMGISTVWMYKLIEDAKYMDYEGWERLLPVAYLFNNAQSFYEVTKGLVYHYDGFFSSIEHEMMDCLPTGVLGKDQFDLFYFLDDFLTYELN
ncbi:uncharacterized protein K452DRAFT_238843 [Aplosporella prunicola CBS 121167]|uniref:BTB domain-containing protein n=1 Tax=Aplosporella prunicola CBS 121167 TaxID=1176127 RepID=A0A6A6AY79_9PEZI|nr:uncharacterized protein K452DRAFT_238843 [Aplosporella prunicola CBS 121167]KAF2135727.1 hypothetical protein K452DRAFT_238843 [Aplosporella prunicola CBS 121167]